MKKFEVCPKCGTIEPPVTLFLEELEKYQDKDSPPDNRVYALVCLTCGETIDKFTVDNTIVAAAALRNEMDEVYGGHINIPLKLILES